MSQAGESFAAGAGVRGLAGQSNSNFDHTSFGVATLRAQGQARSLQIETGDIREGSKARRPRGQKSKGGEFPLRPLHCCCLLVDQNSRRSPSCRTRAPLLRFPAGTTVVLICPKV